MARSHLSRLTRSACALAASACVLLAIAAAAPARIADTRVGGQPVVDDSTPTVVRQTVLRPASSGPDTITLVLIATGAAAALLGASYLGARIAIRTPRTGGSAMSPFIKPVLIAVLIAAVVAALSIPGGALAQPAHDVFTSSNAVHHPNANHPSITFTNPLGRSRGPGAGMGLL
jgi:membrane associated rhomboid family serine protease